MVRNLTIRYIAVRCVVIVALPLACLLTGCGKSDSGPPPGATTTDNAPPDVSFDSPADKPGDSTKPAADGKTPDSAKQGDKTP